MRRRKLNQLMMAGLASVSVTGAFADEAKPTAEQVKALTLQASSLVAAKGIDQARAAFNQEGEFKHGELYVNVIDSKGTWVIYPPKPEGVGRSVINVQDADGKFIVQDILKVAADSGEGWTEYRWKNPVSNLLQMKQTYVKKVSGTDYVVYIGVYK